MKREGGREGGREGRWEEVVENEKVVERDGVRHEGCGQQQMKKEGRHKRKQQNHTM